MDDRRFDELTRALRSRRTVLGVLAGAVATLLGPAGREKAGAHNVVPAGKRVRDPRRRLRCLRRARAHNRRCHPQPLTTTCAGRCGTRRNNCGQSVACPACPVGKTCLANGSCAQACSQPPLPIGSPTGCGCSHPEVGNGGHCVPDVLTCEQMVQPGCASTTACPAGHQCQETFCSPGDTPENRCAPLCTG